MTDVIDFNIKASVGEQEKNNSADVRKVQLLLNHAIESNVLVPLGPLKTDGMAGPKTKLAIREFQRRVVGMAGPDGRVDPNGKTLQKLISLKKHGVKKILVPSVIMDATNIFTSPIEGLLKTRLPNLLPFNLPHHQSPTPLAPSGQALNLSNLSKAQFVEQLHAAAKKEEETSKVPAAITTAQGILETGYGKHIPVDMNNGKFSHNLFGIKGIGPAGFVSVYTHEVINHQRIKIVAKFKAYNNYQESVSGRTQFFKKNSIYWPLLNLTDPVAWAKGLKEAGYATDPKYAEILIKLMNMWKLI